MSLYPIFLAFIGFLVSFQATAQVTQPILKIAKNTSNLNITQDFGHINDPILQLTEVKDDSNPGWKEHPVLTGQISHGKLILNLSGKNAAFRAYRPESCFNGDVDITENLRIYEFQTATPKTSPKHSKTLQAFSEKSDGTWQVESRVWANKAGYIRANWGGETTNITLQPGWNTTLFNMVDFTPKSTITVMPHLTWTWRN